MCEATCYQKSKEVMLNRAKEYHKNKRKSKKEKQEINRENYLKKKKI